MMLMSSLCLVGQARADITVTTDEKAFFLELQKAVTGDNKEWLLAHICDDALLNGKPLGTSQKLLTDYQRIIDQSVRSQVAAQAADNLFKNWQGLMVGNGAIWFDKYDCPTLAGPVAAYAIIAFNTGADDGPPYTGEHTVAREGATTKRWLEDTKDQFQQK